SEAHSPRFERGNGAIATRERLVARLLEAEHRRIRRLDAVGVCAGTFAELGGSAFDIENVVLDLECEADLGTEFSQCRAFLNVLGSGRNRAEQHARLNQSASLLTMHALELAFTEDLFDGFEVD